MDNVSYIKTYEVTIVELNSKAESSLVVKSGEDQTTGDFVIWCELDDQEITSSHFAYFKAFQQFRDKLLEAGYGLKCNGARLNAAPMTMMESTPRVYLVELGHPISTDSIVNIWDEADIDEFPASREQNRFYDKWSRERKAISDREERKAPRSIKILILTPLISDILTAVLLIIYDCVPFRKLGIESVARAVSKVGWFCLGFSLSVGFIMAIIGTVMAMRQKKPLFIVLGLLLTVPLAIFYIYLFICIFFIGFGGP